MAMMMVPEIVDNKLTEAELAQRVEGIAKGRSKAIIAAYKELRPNATPIQIWADVVTDHSMGAGTVTLAERKVKQGRAPLYMYLVTYEVPAHNGALRASHGEDMALVFDTSLAARLNPGRGEDLMRASKWLVSALCTGALALIAAAPSHAEEARRPAAPVKTPLGTASTEVLLSKITVSDLAKSYDFYTKIIGLKRALTVNQKEPVPLPTVTDDSGPAFVEVGLNFSGSFADPFFDLVHQRGEKPTPSSANMTVVGFKVPDAPAVIRRVKEAGYEVIREAPVVGPGEMSIGMVRDPDGYRVEIIQAASYPATGH
jgi:catechol 2,3-dioxygenase-like lactoylglutathione lyase family enzyme